MTTTNLTLLRGLGNGRDAWLDKYDPDSIIGRKSGWYSGYYDANNNNQRDDVESECFFREQKGKDGRVYVLRMVPDANTGEFRLSVSIRDPATGALVPLTGTQIPTEFAALSASLTLTSANFNQINTLFEKFCLQTTSVYVPVTVVTFNQEGYAGWGYGDERVDDFDPNTQGDPTRNTKPFSIGGFGGGFVSQEWDYRIRLHWVTAKEAYERLMFQNMLLPPGTDGYETNFWQEGSGPNDDIALKNGVVIGKIVVKINGVDTTTMGFTYRDGSRVYTAYWDPNTKTNVIAKVMDGDVDITESVVTALGGRTLGRTWEDIQVTLGRVPRTIPGVPGVSDPFDYGGDDKYSAQSSTGVIRPVGGPMSQTLKDLIKKWSDYIQKDVITSLPRSYAQMQEFLADMLKLSTEESSDLLRLFCGTPDSGNDVAAGLALMAELFKWASLNASPLDNEKVAEMMGRLMFLAGSELGGAGRNKGETEGDGKRRYYRALLLKLNDMSSAVIGSSLSSPISVEQRKRLSQAYLRGLVNWDSASSKSKITPVLSPQAAINSLVDHLRKAGGLDTSAANRQTAEDLSLFGREMIKTLALVNLSRTITPNADYISTLVAMAENVAIVESNAQQLSSAFFGQMAAVCMDSSDARKYFEDQQGATYEYSRKIQDSLMGLFERALRASADAVRSLCSHN